MHLLVTLFSSHLQLLPQGTSFLHHQFKPCPEVLPHEAGCMEGTCSLLQSREIVLVLGEEDREGGEKGWALGEWSWISRNRLVLRLWQWRVTGQELEENQQGAGCDSAKVEKQYIECPGWRRVMENGELKDGLWRGEWCCWNGNSVTQQRLGCRCGKWHCGEGKVWQQLAGVELFLHCGAGKPSASSWSPVSATYRNRSPQPETPSLWGSSWCPGAKPSRISSAGPSSGAFVPPE